MANRINKLFASKATNVLSMFYTAGFPQLGDTARIARALELAGCDMIEIGIPFSDPVADGPVIQESNKRALENGMTLRRLLEDVKEIRKSSKLPIVLMGYLNPVMQFGMENFCVAASAAGVDGLIIPDMPADVYLEQYKDYFDSNGLCNTFLISPTTSPERIRTIDDASDGFIYAVSASSTTGAKVDFSNAQKDYFRKLKELKLRNPFLIGFGISTKHDFSTACEYGAGAIVGSAFIAMLKQSGDIDKDVQQFVTNLRH